MIVKINFKLLKHNKENKIDNTHFTTFHELFLVMSRIWSQKDFYIPETCVHTYTFLVALDYDRIFESSNVFYFSSSYCYGNCYLPVNVTNITPATTKLRLIYS